MKSKTTLLLGAISLALASSAQANADHNNHSQPVQQTPHHHQMMSCCNHQTAEHIAAYNDAMLVMAKDMGQAYQAVNSDVAFMQGMLAHHIGAVEMSKVQLKFGKDNSMKALAQTIIDAQTSEIELMQNWLTANKNQAKADPNMPQISANYQQADDKYHTLMMNGMIAENPDVAFAKGMIPHHQGAIAMADIVLNTTKDEQIIKLANAIKAAQQPEIDQMEQWLAKQK